MDLCGRYAQVGSAIGFFLFGFGLGELELVQVERLLVIQDRGPG